MIPQGTYIFFCTYVIKYYILAAMDEKSETRMFVIITSKILQQGRKSLKEPRIDSFYNRII